MKKIVFCISILVFIACSTVPIIGRKQLNLLPESQMVAMSLTNYQSFLDSSDVAKTGKDLLMVKNSGKRISEAVEKLLKDNKLEDRISTCRWEFN